VSRAAGGLKNRQPLFCFCALAHGAIIEVVRYFISRRVPTVARVLLVESGSRHLIAGLIPKLPEVFGEGVPADLVTCFPGAPEGVERVYRVSDFRGAAGRARLFRTLASNGYSVAGILCSAEPIMTNWKWALAARLPVKVFVINENGDYFWLDRGHARSIRHFVLFRAGLTGAGAAHTLSRLLLFPFTLLYLLLYASGLHLRRALRGGYR
jgi:hypothetical protein